ncbi:MAG: hypothetical protein JNL49_04980 [Bacteroidia bacterium]|nr:hypothetical protein [Bacteroidia bacterium]
MPITVYTNAKVPIQLEDKPLAAAGGEGTVYRVKGTGAFANSCVKIYHPQKRTGARKNKVEFMIQNKPQVVSSANFIICWPTEMVFDGNRTFIGFVMPLAFSGSEKLYELTTTKIPKRLQLHWGKFDRATSSGIEKRLKVCVNIAIAIHSIHQSGKYAIVDYKPQNILITNEGKISITDVDSFQIANNGSVLFYSEVATPEYAPPEASRLNPSRTLVPESWDRFSLAVSFYEILFGIHPYAATCDGQYHAATTIGEKIQKGLFVHGSKKSYLTVIPTIHNNFLHLPTSLGRLFIKAFEEGHTNNNVRPSAEEWGQAIHYELITKTGIKGNTISAPQKKNSSPSTITYDRSSSVPRNTNYTKPVAKSQVATKKEEYMIWKILTVILIIALAIVGIKLTTSSSELGSLRGSVSSLQSQNSSLQSQLSQLQSSQYSSQNSYNSQISELQTAVDQIGAKYPISINEITFNNVTRELEEITTETHDFPRNDLRYVQPVIKFNSNLRSGGEYDINYKFFNPNGTLLTGSDSPYGFTWHRSIYVSGNFSKDNTEKLSGFGFSGSITGRYKVEIWCNGVLVGESYFNINDY